jgi:hypothetical protein
MFGLDEETIFNLFFPESKEGTARERLIEFFYSRINKNWFFSIGFPYLLVNKYKVPIDAWQWTQKSKYTSKLENHKNSVLNFFTNCPFDQNYYYFYTITAYKRKGWRRCYQEDKERFNQKYDRDLVPGRFYRINLYRVSRKPLEDMFKNNDNIQIDGINYRPIHEFIQTPSGIRYFERFLNLSNNKPEIVAPYKGDYMTYSKFNPI